MRYYELRIPEHRNVSALDTAVTLADRSPFGEYVLYEQNGTWFFAGGTAGRITVTAREVRADWQGSVTVRTWEGSPFRVMDEMLATLPAEQWQVFGWASFELAHAMHSPAWANGPGDPDLPLIQLIVPHTLVAISSDLTVIRSVSRQDLLDMLDLLESAEPRKLAEPSPVVTTAGRSEYCAIVATAVDEIRRGLFQKVVLSRRVPVGHRVDLVQTYHLGRSATSPARSSLLSLGGISAAGFSPETIVEVGPAGRVSTRPLAGTRSLGDSEEEEGRLRAELLADPKEIFEHAISMRSAWEDLSAVCLPGTVRVDEPMRIKQYGAVQHLGSVVSGRLARGRTGLDALGALFPAVTVSGLPRAEACACIARLEAQPRGIYGGAVLRAGSDGRLDAALVLRTVFQAEGEAWLQAGAGIVRDSRPAREFQETREKLGSVAPFIVEAAQPEQALRIGSAVTGE
jgi:salicylate synthetase